MRLSDKWLLLGCLVAGVGLGFYLAALIPVYFTPFVGCTAWSGIGFQPGCSIWPEVGRGALLVAPCAIFIKHSAVLFGALTLVLILNSFGGVVGINDGAHLDVLNGSVGPMAHLGLQLPALVSSTVILCVGYFANRWYMSNAA